MDIDRGFHSALPSGKGFPTMDEDPSSYSHHHYSSSASSSTSAKRSPSSTPSTTPPTLSYEPRQAEPYGDGSIEILPGVFLGAEDSVRNRKWTSGRTRVRVLNVAQDIDDPFDRGVCQAKGKEKETVELASYPPSDGMPAVEYCHLRWSHGESGLAELPAGARLSELLDMDGMGSGRKRWRFWEAIRWLETGRRAGEPVLIQ